VDLATMWNFGDPAGSEARFREALATASGDEALILRTQIARTLGLRRELVAEREMLEAMRADIDGAGAEPQVRWWLEWGRAWISAVTTSDERTADALATARDAYTRAFDLASAAGLDGLAIDAVHMQAFVDTDPTAQLVWNDRGLSLAAASSDPAAKRWEASLRNNRGMALHELGRDAHALAEFEVALALRQAQGDAVNIRIAWWMVAWAMRLLGRADEALEIQLRLDAEWAAAGEPDPYVWEELEHLYRAKGDEARAAQYAARRAAASAD
jgi:hypothetical protein